jgi:hypothetical protein
MVPAGAYFVGAEGGVEVPDDVEGVLAGLPEVDAGAGAGVAPDDGFGEVSFLSPSVFSLGGGAVASLPVGGLSLSE